MNEQPKPAEQTMTTTPAVASPPTMVGPAIPADARTAGSSVRRILAINGLILLALILVGLGAFWLWHQGYYFYTTDDALVTGTTVAVAPTAGGAVTIVNRSVGDTVRAGDTVVTLRTATGGRLTAVSPINGTVINQAATPGEVVPVGQPVAQVVNLTTLYVTAYVEETHIGDVAVGQGVDVTVEAVKDTTFHGRVMRILPATANTFSLLPTTDYASGNFTKVTQRIPVQIMLDGYQGHALFPGESARATIHIHS